MCYHAEFGRSMLKDVNTNRGKLKNWGVLGLHHLGMVWLTPRNMPFPTMCYLAECGRSALQDVSRTAKIGVLGLCHHGTGAWLTRIKQAPPHM